MGNPQNLWASGASSSASSIYSQEQGLPADITPLISRKDSSSSSKASTVYSEDTIKSMGYKPFEYWKGPRPVAYPGDIKKNKRTVPLPPRITGVNLTGPVNSLRDFKPMPDAKIREVKIYMDAVPPSPTVKDRYAQRRAERARRKRQASRRVEEWPGWVPDRKAYGVGRSRRARGDGSAGASMKRYSDASTVLSSARQRWWNPRTWRRRWWGVVLSILMVGIIASIITATIVTRDNGPAYPNYKRLNYRVAETFNTEDFFDHFNYFTGPDPSQGFVHYASQAQAKALNLTYMTATSAILRVDASVGNATAVRGASTGRYSVRVMSKQQFTSGGLFLFDVRHTPVGCGTWPALGLGDAGLANGLANGKMDVMEATNLARTGNTMSLHTGPGCDMTNRVRNMTGVASAGDGDCDSSAAGNPGCSVVGNASTYGLQFNAGGGGVMALEWRAEGIRIWQFARGSIPLDMRPGTSTRPDPSSWGRALADFPSTGCDVNSHFRNQSIIMNINLCGEAAGANYAASGCPSNCTDFVANHPRAFQNAYWEFGTLRVYQAV